MLGFDLRHIKQSTAVRWGAGACLLLSVAACTGTIYRTTELGGHSVLSIDARQRVVVSRMVGQKHIFCAEPSPDAIVAQASYATAGLGSGAAKEALLAGGLGESAAAIGLRTQTIQLLRDGYYRVCEAYLNEAIDECDYKRILNHIDRFMIALVALETVTGVVAPPSVVIGATGSLKLGADGSVEGNTNPITPVVNEIAASGATLTTEQTKAVVEIVKAYDRNPRGGFGQCQPTLRLPK